MSESINVNKSKVVKIEYAKEYHTFNAIKPYTVANCNYETDMPICVARLSEFFLIGKNVESFTLKLSYTPRPNYLAVTAIGPMYSHGIKAAMNFAARTVVRSILGEYITNYYVAVEVAGKNIPLTPFALCNVSKKYPLVVY